MATSSIFENVKITDSKVAEAFVNAIEASEASSVASRAPRFDSKMASREDIARLHEMRKHRRANG